MRFSFPSFIRDTAILTGARITEATRRATNGLKNAASAADMT